MSSSYRRLHDPQDHRDQLLQSPQYAPYQVYPPPPIVADPVASQEQDRRLKIRIRQFRVVIRSLAFACAVVVVSLMTHNLVVFYRTAQLVQQGIRAWPAQPKLWPTYVMLGVASLNTLLATMVLVAYFWSVGASNRWNTARFILTITTIGFGLVMWAVAAAGTNGTTEFEGIGTQSLWSAACDATAEQLQHFDKEINFKRFCIEQQWGVICAFIGIAFEALTIISYLWVYARIKHRQRMKEASMVPMNPMYPPVYINPPSPVSSPQPYQPYFDRRPSYGPGPSQPYNEPSRPIGSYRGDMGKETYQEA